MPGKGSESVYIKTKQLRKQLNKIPELPPYESISDKAVKAGRLFDLIMSESYVNREIEKVPREDWMWLRELLINYSYGDVYDDEFWSVVLDTSNNIEVASRLEDILAALSPIEVSQYV